MLSSNRTAGSGARAQAPKLGLKKEPGRRRDQRLCARVQDLVLAVAKLTNMSDLSRLLVRELVWSRGNKLGLDNLRGRSVFSAALEDARRCAALEKDHRKQNPRWTYAHDRSRLDEDVRVEIFRRRLGALLRELGSFLHHRIDLLG